MSPQKHLAKNNYDKAFQTSLKKLKKGKNYTDNLYILQIALREQIAQQTKIMQPLLDSKFVYEAILGMKMSRELQHQIKAASKFTGDYFIKDYRRLIKEEEEARKFCAEKCFNVGVKKLEASLSTGMKILAIKAINDFENARFFKYKNIDKLDSLIHASREAGKIIYSVEGYEYISFFKKWNKNPNNLVKIYNKNDIDTATVDCFVSIKENRSAIVNSSSCSFESFCEKVQDGYETITEQVTVTNSDGKEETVVIEKEVPTYREVFGDVTIQKSEKRGEMSVQIEVIPNSQNCVLSSTSFSKNLVFTAENYEISGDIDAIPSHYISATETLPHDFVIEDEMREALHRQVYCYLMSDMKKFSLTSRWERIFSY